MLNLETVALAGYNDLTLRKTLRRHYFFGHEPSQLEKHINECLSKQYLYTAVFSSWMQPPQWLMLFYNYFIALQSSFPEKQDWSSMNWLHHGGLDGPLEETQQRVERRLKSMKSVWLSTELACEVTEASKGVSVWNALGDTLIHALLPLLFPPPN